jgi:hypothetical protein
VDAQRLRPAIAFLVVPLVPVAAYSLLLYWMQTLANGPRLPVPMTMTQVVAWYLQIAYACMLLGWLPLVLLLRALRRTSMLDFALAGAVLAGGLIVVFFGSPFRFMAFSAVCALVGAGCGWLFHRIAGPGLGNGSMPGP